MAVRKYYAVKNGKKVGIFDTWEQCKRQVDGFKGAIYKSFTDLKQAENFLNDEKEELVICKDTAVAYVDGSFDVKSGRYSSGVLILYKGEELEFSKAFEDEEMAEMRNVSGEIMGAVIAMKYALKYKIKKLVIYHDYQGLSMWATGQWKTNKKGTLQYAKFCKQCFEEMEISFVKVKAHSGDKYNDKADELAKRALGLI